MYARLWWKEARVLWPLWVALSLMACGVQGFALRFGSAETLHSGALTMVALGWALVYAFAAGAAAFAGERETKTLSFLDALPVSRRTLWGAKAAFALVTAFALALGLAALSLIGTLPWQGPRIAWANVLWLGALLIEAVAWGLLWSAVWENALLAAVSAVGTVGLLLASDVPIFNPSSALLLGPGRTFPLRVTLALGALIASRLLIVQGQRPEEAVRSVGGAFGGRLLGSPVVGRLAWQTYREARTTWLVLTAIGLAVPLLLIVRDLPRGWVSGSVSVSSLTSSVLACLAAGVSVFAPENRARTHRFYVDHGLRPGLVWVVKVGVWAGGVVVSGGLLILLLITAHESSAWSAHGLSLGLLLLASSFAVGQFCGLVIRRTITAGTIAVLVLLLLWMPQWGLARSLMIREWTLVLTPFLLLAISWAWSGDWMNDRLGAGRWARLAGLVLVAVAALLSLYIGYRGWSVPDMGLPFDVAALRAESLPADQNAAVVYRRAGEELEKVSAVAATEEAAPSPGAMGTSSGTGLDAEISRVIDEGWDPQAGGVIRWWQGNRPSIELVRRASALPRARFQRVDALIPSAPLAPTVEKMPALARIMALDSRERQWRGDLTGAWDDIHVLFRMAEQLTASAPPAQRRVALDIHSQAFRLAESWAADPRQSPERLHAALDDFRRLPPPRPPSDTLKVEYAGLDRALDLPLEEIWPPMRWEKLGMGPFWTRLSVDWGAAPPWERQRARRVFRLLAADRLQACDSEPWQRTQQWWTENGFQGGITDLHWPPGQPSWHRSAAQLTDDWLSTPLARVLDPWFADPRDVMERDLVERRGLEQILALRSWQRRHGGAYPATLEELVPSELARLPLDPYSGVPFRYGRARAELSVRPGNAGLGMGGGVTPGRSGIRPGQWLLWSVGPDRADNRAVIECRPTHNQYFGDIVFPLSDGGERAGK